MRKSVIIMMATYNGQEFLSEQIESIINQTYHDWKLIIQDDGSTDETVNIIKRYCDIDTRIVFWHNQKQHGAYFNFHSLANSCKKINKFDYYMFADQDDFWLPTKVESMVKLIDNDDIPRLCYADMDIVDAQSKTISASINNSLGLSYANKYSVFFSHNVFGCNVIMNGALFFSVPFIKIENEKNKILSHDNLYTKFAAALGQVSYCHDITMHYRRHGNNVTAKQKYSFSIKRIIDRLVGINDLAKDHALTYNQTLIAIDLLRKVKNADNSFLDGIEKCIKYGGPYAVVYILKHGISWGKPIKTISRTLIMLFGIYKKYLIVINHV